MRVCIGNKWGYATNSEAHRQARTMALRTYEFKVVPQHQLPNRQPAKDPQFKPSLPVDCCSRFTQIMLPLMVFTEHNEAAVSNRIQSSTHSSSYLRCNARSWGINNNNKNKKNKNQAAEQKLFMREISYWWFGICAVDLYFSVNKLFEEGLLPNCCWICRLYTFSMLLLIVGVNILIEEQEMPPLTAILIGIELEITGYKHRRVNSD